MDRPATRLLRFWVLSALGYRPGLGKKGDWARPSIASNPRQVCNLGPFMILATVESVALGPPRRAFLNSGQTSDSAGLINQPSNYILKASNSSAYSRIQRG